MRRFAAVAEELLGLGGLGHIDHRKLAVVDGRIGWVGGAGIEDHFQDGRFHDLFLRVSEAARADVESLRRLPINEIKVDRTAPTGTLSAPAGPM